MTGADRQRIQAERHHQVGKAIEAGGDLIEALRILYQIADPSVNNNDLDLLHNDANNLVSRIVSLKGKVNR